MQDCRTLLSKAWQQPHMSQLGSSEFSPRNCTRRFLWISEFPAIKFVNIVFFFYILQGKFGTCALGVTIILQQRHCSKLRDFCFIIEVSEKITQSQKKLPTDNFSVKGVLFFIPTQFIQAPQLFT